MATDIQPYRHDYIQPPFAEATVMDVMHPGVLACMPDTTLRDAARAMSDHGIHALVVEGITQHVKGNRWLVWRVFTDMDLVRAMGEDDLGRKIGDLASAQAVTIDPGAPLTMAAELMAEHSTAHLIVVHDQRPTGIVSSADLARAIAWSRS